MQEKILVVGALGQLGTELACALCRRYGTDNVIAADLSDKVQHTACKTIYRQLNVLDKNVLREVIRREKITQVYLLVAMLSATGERQPQKGWQLNMQSLLHVLDAAVELKVKRVFWPSSIAVFGLNASRIKCPQHAVQDPGTVYGISKLSGEQWCTWYHEKHGLDVRSIRYPGLISHGKVPEGGTTDYVVEIFHHALKDNMYECYLSAQTILPMMYMDDAVRATIELMDAPKEKIRIRTSYNLAGLSFTPQQLGVAINQHLPGFRLKYAPDVRQQIADSWPKSVDDTQANQDWGWKPAWDLDTMVADMLMHLKMKVDNTVV